MVCFPALSVTETATAWIVETDAPPVAPLSAIVSLIEVPAAEAERIARALDGRTVRRRRLTVHVDRGPSAGPGRPKEKR